MKTVLPKPAANSRKTLLTCRRRQNRPFFGKAAAGMTTSVLWGHKKGVVGWIFGKLEEFAKVFHRFCRYIE